MQVADALADSPGTAFDSRPITQRAPAFDLVPIRFVAWGKLQSRFASLQTSAAMLTRNGSAPEARYGAKIRA
jgi:hypothetical protein